MAWPNREPETGRGLRRSPLQERLAAQGACFGVKNGWERPNWFARDGVQPRVDYSFDRQNWFACHAAEHHAARERVALFEQSAFSKFTLQGRDAVHVLQRLCGNNVDVSPGRTIYTGLFNQRGGFESDLTLVRLDEETFYIISGTSQTVRDLNWISRHIQGNEQAVLTDVTNQYGVLGVMGPHARGLLSKVSEADLSNASFPFGTARTLNIGMATARAVRLTYVGELGWELHVPTEQLLLAYDVLLGAGAEFEVANAGHYAINSLRLEKGFRAWGAELSPDDTPLEAGLAFAIDWNKPFLGRDTLLEQKKTGVKRRLAIFVLNNPDPVLWGSELIYRNGKPVGYTTSGSYGHTVGGAIAMGYINHREGVDAAFVESGRYEINVNGARQEARVHLRAPYDPERRRILA
jgi:4-methylaminobutanoate oxidase (formaldehyde-forming)